MPVCAIAHPSLALVKYWGKAEGGINVPAVPSLALTLEGLSTQTRVEEDERDRVFLDGVETQDPKILTFLDRFRQVTGSNCHFRVETRNDFPTAAGLASSSSGFAALAAALWLLVHGSEAEPRQLSRLARLGSGSACRSVYGGWTAWEAGAEEAVPLFSREYWPEVRVLALLVEEGPKPLGSRDAMELCRRTSPYFPAWVADGPGLWQRARHALERQDWEELGHCTRLSYLRMFATMLGADPPVLYWKPNSLRLLVLAEQLRAQGLAVFETMDAGPQVKLLCLEPDLPAVLQFLRSEVSDLRWMEARPGSGVRAWYCD